MTSNVIWHGDDSRRLTHLGSVLGPLAKNKNQFVNDRLTYAVEMTERAVGQYVDLVAEVCLKIQVIDGEIKVLKRDVVTVLTGGDTSPRVPEPKPFGGARSFK